MLENINLFSDFSLTSNSILNKSSIDSILIGLNNVLCSMDKFLMIKVYGGSSLCLLNKYRESTYDIDTMSDDNELLELCISKLGLTKDIVNTEIEVFLTSNESLDLYKEFSNLSVYVPSLEYLLAMKVRAGRSKDLYDIKCLLFDLGIDSVEKVKCVFVKHYSPIQFNSSKINFVNSILKEM